MSTNLLSRLFPGNTSFNPLQGPIAAGALTNVARSQIGIQMQIPTVPEPISGLDLAEIQALDLTHFRNSNLPVLSYMLLLVPIIGWIALGCLKWHYVNKHSAAEKIMQNGSFDSASTEQKIEIVKNAIKVSGPLAWQYQYELAKLYLINNQIHLAANVLEAIKRQLGFPDGHQYHNDGFGTVYVKYHNGYQALLQAALFAIKNQYEEAYDAYGEVRFFNTNLANSRAHQSALVQKLNNSQHKSPRALQILKAHNLTN